MSRSITGWAVPALLLLRCAHAQVEVTQASGGEFAIGDIRVEGLQRISEGTVYNYLPVNIGDRLDGARIREAIKALYATGFFRDVELRRDGGVLIVAVLERPTIESFEVKGNKDIQTEDLQRSLRNVGLASGKSFDASVLDEVKRYLTEQYFSRGKYAVKVDAKAEDLPGNRVKVAIDIAEGSRARIRQINVVGNAAFTDAELLSQFQSSTPNWLSWYKQDDRYAKQALTGDLEILQSYYMDRGYADFDIASSQIAISPEKDDMFITVNVAEGDVYRLSEVKLVGDLVVPEPELRRLTEAMAPGQTYSRKVITQTTEAIRTRLGLDGYAFAKVDAVPKLDADRKEVALSLVVDPGNRVYARRVNFHGASGVNDEVFRRESRQLEGAYLSNAAVDRSRQRIQRLPFIEKAEVETVPVPGTPDLVDVDFTVKEGLPGQFGGSIGYSQSSSLILGANIVHSNFLGRGERIALEASGSQHGKGFDISHTDPYLTLDGISRTLNFSHRKAYRLDSEAAEFSSETWLASALFSYPITEYQSLQLSASWQQVDLASAYYSSTQFADWVMNNGDSYQRAYDGFTLYGTRYDALELGLAWVFDSRDRTLFPTRGANHRLSLTVTPPFSEVQYYLANYDYRQFFRLPYLDKLPFSFATRIAYGAPLGDTTALPPHRNFRMGGADSLRGFEASTLGPRDSLGHPYGGDLAVSGQVEMIIPLPEKFASSTRATLFYDIGQLAYVGDTRFTDKSGAPVKYPFDLDGFRSSVGIGLEWLAPLGLFRFSYAIPLRYRAGSERTYGDERKGFEFSMGNAF